jgi:large subunit ribosomal protein L4
MELSLYNSQGKETGKKISLNDAVFGIDPSQQAIYLDVKQYLANQRQGTAKTKERAEVARSTRKIKKQKGTGGARAGSIKSPLFIGGGTVFGPRPRNYGFKLNKSLKKLARKSALSAKAAEGNLLVVDSLNLNEPKTKEFVQILKNFDVLDKKTLWIVGESNKSVYLSSRNLKGSDVVNASDLNTYQLVNADKIVLTEASIKKIEELLTGE